MRNRVVGRRKRLSLPVQPVATPKREFARAGPPNRRFLVPPYHAAVVVQASRLRRAAGTAAPQLRRRAAYATGALQAGRLRYSSAFRDPRSMACSTEHWLQIEDGSSTLLHSAFYFLNSDLASISAKEGACRRRMPSLL